MQFFLVFRCRYRFFALKMLQLNIIREQPELVAERLSVKNIPNPAETVQKLIALDESRRNQISRLEVCRSQANNIAKSIGVLISSGKKDEAENAKKETSELKIQINELEISLSQIDAELQALLVTLPNLPHESVPRGKTPSDNTLIFENKLTVSLPSNAKPHWWSRLRQSPR